MKKGLFQRLREHEKAHGFGAYDPRDKSTWNRQESHPNENRDPKPLPRHPNEPSRKGN